MTANQDFTPEEQKIEGALQVIGMRDHAVVKMGETQAVVPTLSATDQELNGFNGFLARTQLGAIERKKQAEMRQILARTETDILRARTEAIIKAHKGITQAALAEILIVAREFGLSKVREAEIRDQEGLQRAVLRLSIQYCDFLKQLPEADLRPEVLKSVQRTAEQIYNDKLVRIRESEFKV